MIFYPFLLNFPTFNARTHYAAKHPEITVDLATPTTITPVQTTPIVVNDTPFKLRHSRLSLTSSAMKRKDKPSLLDQQEFAESDEEDENSRDADSLSSALSSGSSRSQAAPKDDSTFLAELAHYDLDKLIQSKSEPDSPAAITLRLDRLALFFCTKRDKVYHENLENQSKAKLLAFARQDRYAELVYLTTQELLGTLTESNQGLGTLLTPTTSETVVKKIFQETLEKVCSSYQNAIESRLEKGQSLKDERPSTLLRVMEQHLHAQATESELVSILTNKTPEQLTTLLAEAEKEYTQTQENSDDIQMPFAELACRTQQLTHLASQHSIVKLKKHELSLSEKETVLQSMAVETQDANGNTLLDKAAEYGNTNIIENILACAKHVQVPEEEILRDTLVKLINNQRYVNILHLAAAKNCLFNPALVEKIRLKQPGLFPETPIKKSQDPLSTYFDEDNCFILTPRLIELIDADTLCGLVQNICATDRYQEHIENLLNKAIQLADTNSSTAILNYATRLNVDIIPLLRTALENINNDEKKLLPLAAHGALFNRNSVRKIRSQSSSDFSQLFDKDNNIILNEIRLQHANDDTLASLINYVNEAQWPLLHEEITRRYYELDPFKELVPESIWNALNKKQQRGERFKKLAEYFDEAFIYVVTQYKNAVTSNNNYAKKHYMKKVDMLLNVVQKYSATDEKSLQQQALKIATILAHDTSSNAIPCEGSIATASATKTQRFFSRKQATLTASQKQNLQEPMLQLSDRIPLDSKNLKNVLDQIAGSITEQQARQKRAVVSRAVFRNLLEYLKAQDESTKNQSIFACWLSPHTDETSPRITYDILDNHIQSYIKGDRSASALIDALKPYYETPANNAATSPTKSWMSGGAAMYSPLKAPFKDKATQLLAEAVNNGEELLKAYSIPPVC